MTLAYLEIDSPVGRLRLAGDDDSLHVFAFMEGRKDFPVKPGWVLHEPALRELASAPSEQCGVVCCSARPAAPQHGGHRGPTRSCTFGKE